jgi:hypothetical protein
MEDEAVGFHVGPSGTRILDAIQKLGLKPNGQPKNEVRITVVGPLAHIEATVDRAGLAKLRARLDAIESMLDD